MKQRLHFLKRLSVLFVFFGLMALPGVGWGQQVIGSFPSMEGGFNGTTAGTLGTTLSSTVWTRQNTANTTASVTDSGGRSSGPYATVNSNSATGTRVLQSPSTSSNLSFNGLQDSILLQV
jgi:trimeric autotransporter adhesin